MKTKMTKAMYGKSMMKKGGVKKPTMKKGGSIKKMQAGGQSDKPYTRPKEFLPEKGPITDMKERKDLADLLLKYKADPRVTRELMRTGQLAPDITLKTKPASEMRVGKTMKKGGAMKKMQAGGKTGAQLKKEGQDLKAKGQALKAKGEGQALKAKGAAMKKEGQELRKEGMYVKENPYKAYVDRKLFGENIYQKPKFLFKKGGAMKKMKTGGMVNPNSSVSKQTVPGSKGVQPGVNPKASSSKVTGSRGSGKVNTPPSKAVPTAKRGGMVKKKR